MLIPNEVWEVIFGMIEANYAKIDESLGNGQFGIAAHYDSKNIALFELLEKDSGLKKPAKTPKERFAALKGIKRPEK